MGAGSPLFPSSAPDKRSGWHLLSIRLPLTLANSSVSCSCTFLTFFRIRRSIFFLTHESCGLMIGVVKLTDPPNVQFV